ncbi:unnamed protein product [Spirodela intermedia]|uniref:Uncharacterized protein n=1 Tax=Spirodela intermedia TaxID=51605 RepID=A0A7I8JED4_SPIIN|nr:unnamed protein product [Spirodela intermedia]CAA6668524.1 unnamed protein product [Spirodela intermedia]
MCVPPLPSSPPPSFTPLPCPSPPLAEASPSVFTNAVAVCVRIADHPPRPRGGK